MHNECTRQDGLNFDAMHDFLTTVNDALTQEGSRAVRVFPPASEVLILFSDRLASEVVSRSLPWLT
jgi:recyclin-1